MKTLVGTVVGFILAAGWQWWRDSRSDRQKRDAAVRLLMSRIGNDVYFTKAVMEGLASHKVQFTRVDFGPELQSQPHVGLEFLSRRVIQGLDQYDKLIRQASSAKEHALSVTHDPALARNAIDVLVVIYDNLIDVGTGLLNLLSLEHPKLGAEWNPALGSSFVQTLPKG